MFNKTRIAKMACHVLVASQVAKVVSKFVSDNTDLDEDALSVKVGSIVVGDVVASQTDALTDAMVDKIAARFTKTVDETVTA